MTLYVPALTHARNCGRNVDCRSLSDTWNISMNYNQSCYTAKWKFYPIETEDTQHTHSHFNGHFSRWMRVSRLPPNFSIYHLFLNCASFLDRPKLSMLSLTQSHQVFFGRHLCLIPSTSHVIQCLTQSLSSVRSTCPNHLNLLFLIIKLAGSNPVNIHDFRCLRCVIFCTSPVNVCKPQL